MDLVVSAAVQEKLQSKHDVVIAEVEECFANCAGRFLKDARKRHKSYPPTLWFIAATDRGRDLKIIFIRKGEALHLKSAYEPNDVETQIYALYGRKP